MVPPRPRQLDHRAWIAAARQQSDEADRIASPDCESGGGNFYTLAHDSLPGYELELEIHRGAQGVVYRAMQTGTGRHVAVKLLHDHALGSRLEQARFEREMHVLATLKHPNIVAIHDGGTHAGRFYLVMDYIQGTPLDRYIADQALSIPDTLDLFVMVCDAVNAAHLRGIIHRDLKPANIRVDAAGRPYVLDFGLAKFSAAPDDASSAADQLAPAMTLTGQFVGSLPWSAPEQADGSPSRIDVRTDVYALGVILYQMLTGKFPYRVSGAMKETLEAILHHAPTPPRTLRREIDDELETILLRCLQKDPARRYQSAGELARDLRRYRAGEPIEAKRDSLAYVLRKRLRSHWVQTSVAAAFLIVIAAGLTTSLTQWRNAVRERDAAWRAHRGEEAARLRAADEAARAQAANAFLQNMLASVEPSVSQGRDLTVREVLDAAALRVEHGELAGQPSVEAAVRLTLGRSYMSLGQMDIAERQLNAALQLNAQIGGPRSKPYGDTLLWLGVLERHRSRVPEAERLHNAALDVFRGVDPPDPLAVASSLGELAFLADMTGRRDDALSLTKEAIDLYKMKLGPDHPEVITLESVMTARSHDHANSFEQAKRCVETLRDHYGEKHPEVTRALTRLAGAYLAHSDVKSAVETQERALELMRELFGNENPETIFTALELSMQYRKREQEAKAVLALEPLLAPSEKIYGPCNETRMTYLVCTAALDARAGNTEAAEQRLRQVFESRDCPEWSEAPLGLNARFNVAEIMIARGDCANAAPMVAVCRSFAIAHPGQSSPGFLARVACVTGEILTCQRRFEEAEAELLEAHRLIANSRMTGPKFKERVVNSIVALYGTWNAAEPDLTRAEKAAEWRARQATP